MRDGDKSGWALNKRRSTKPTTADGSANRVIVKPSELTARQDQVSTFLNNNKRSSAEKFTSFAGLDVAKSPVGVHHRNFLSQVSTLDNEDKVVPIYFKAEFAGRVKSQMGDRAKYQRLIQKRTQARGESRAMSTIKYLTPKSRFGIQQGETRVD